MNVRTATLDDAKIISAMYRDFFACHAELQPAYYQKAESGEYPTNTIKSKTADILVAHENENIAGFIHVAEDKTPPYDSLIPHRFAVCVDLFVTESNRRKGVGTILLDAAKEWAKNRQLDYMELSVLFENESAIRLYTQEDFQPVQYIMRYTL